MPLMRIRSVEIVFEDEMSTCTDTAVLDRSIELIVSDSSDDSTKCVDDLENLHVERDEDSVTLNAEADLSDDNSVSTKECANDPIANEMSRHEQSSEDTREQAPSLLLPNDESTLNISEIGDSGLYTEDACSSHVEVQIAFDDAFLSHSYDVVNVDESSTLMSMYELSEVSGDEKPRLYEYVDSNSDSSDNTAVCDGQASDGKQTTLNDADTDPEEQSLDSNDLQYDSFVDMGRF